MIPPLLSKIASMGHVVFTKKDRPWDLNLIGIRASEGKTNAFDDMLVCLCRDENNLWRGYYWPITTDPGLYYLENPTRVEGTAILKEGQYRHVWKLGKHRGKYDALVQTGNTVTVYRDSNRDSILNMNPDSEMTGWFGINCHASSQSTETSKSTRIDKWSAGCQVHATKKGFDQMMSLVRKQISAGLGSSFTYTLVREEDLA